jgi:hypothetical protein
MLFSFIYDYLILNTTYDKTYKLTKNYLPHMPETVIFQGKGVCDAYARALIDNFADRERIKSIVNKLFI